MEGPTEKDKLIAALKVSGLRTTLWNTHAFLYETKRDDDFQYVLGRELAMAIHAINTLLHKCDNCLDNYVRNYKE